MGVVEITSVYMLMGMLILISLYMKTCSIALLLVFPNLVTMSHCFICNCSFADQVAIIQVQEKQAVIRGWRALERVIRLTEK